MATLRDSTLPLVVIVGPTASGKTALAIKLARKHGGEIICADSRTVYKGMDVGTAKPTAVERAAVPHWGLDLVNPDEHFSAADFKAYANQKIAEIRQRGHIPFLVGGTGLYVDAVLFDFEFGSQADAALRQKLEGLTVSELINYCDKNNVKLPENYKNKRYLIRAIENKGRLPKRNTRPLSNSIVVGITTGKEVLINRINGRAAQIIDDGAIEEARRLSGKFGWESEAMSGIVYRLAREFLAGNIDKQELIRQFAAGDRHLAKRQLTWFRRNKYIKWLNLAEAETFISTSLEENEQSCYSENTKVMRGTPR